MGSDEEAALLKAIALAFNGVKQVTCTRHLRENTGRKLDSLLGSRQPARGAVYDGLFGDSGIAKAADLITFNDAVASFRTGPLASAPPAFQQYFEGSLLHNLCDNVSAGRAEWTNNNCESFNHVLKQSIQWRPQQLPELIQKLREVVYAQYVEADRAMCGLGDFVLTATHARHRLTPGVWQSMTSKQCRRTADNGKCRRRHRLTAMSPWR